MEPTLPDDHSNEALVGLDVDYASNDESRAAIHALQDDDYCKLMIIASYFCKQRRLRPGQLEPQELLGEAIQRTLSGKRRWRKTAVTMLRHLDRAMESISGHTVGDVVAEAEALGVIVAEEFDPRAEVPRRFNRAIAEVDLLAREQLKEIEALFAGAPLALAVLRAKAEGRTESETIIHLGIDKRAFEAARKKIERELDKYALGVKERNDEKDR